MGVLENIGYGKLTEGRNRELHLFGYGEVIIYPVERFFFKLIELIVTNNKVRSNLTEFFLERIILLADLELAL